MILNPVLMIVCAGVSFIGGIAGLIQTENFWWIVPFVIFIFLFCLSLLTPEIKKADLEKGCQVAFKASTQAIKTTTVWISALEHYGARYLAQKRFEMTRARRAKSVIDG